MNLLIGLGNPGLKYQNSRHNIGRLLVEDFVRRQFTAALKEHQYLKSLTFKSGHWIFAVPLTYMNLSGEAVAKLVRHYKIRPADIYIVHDDLDIGVGEYKIQKNRGPAGHHGIESIIGHLSSRDFHRLRVGIGHPRDSHNPTLPVEDYVLLPFTPRQRVIIDGVIDKIIPEIEKIIDR